MPWAWNAKLEAASFFAVSNPIQAVWTNSMSFFDSFFHAYLPCALPKDYQSEFCMEIRRQNDFLSDEILQKYINVHCAVT